MVILFFFFFLMACQGIERKKRTTEIIINKNDEYSTPSLLTLCQFQDKKNGKKYFSLKTTSITP